MPQYGWLSASQPDFINHTMMSDWPVLSIAALCNLQSLPLTRQKWLAAPAGVPSAGLPRHGWACRAGRRSCFCLDGTAGNASLFSAVHQIIMWHRPCMFYQIIMWHRPCTLRAGGHASASSYHHVAQAMPTCHLRTTCHSGHRSAASLCSALSDIDSM